MKSGLIIAASLLGLASAAPALEKRYPHGNYTIDDANSSIKYLNAASWTHVSGQKSFTDGTYSYSNAPNAGFQHSFGGGEVGFTIYGAKKNDRGYFNVFLDGTFIGVGDQYDGSQSGDGSPVAVFSKSGLDTAPHTLTVVNVGYDPRLGKTPYLFLDSLIETD